MMMETTQRLLTSPSTFVTRVARWSSIASACALAITASQSTVLSDAISNHAIPAASGSSIATLHAFLIGSLIFYAFGLATSFALLRRKPWSRRVFVVLLGLGVLLNLSRLLLHALSADEQLALPSEGPAPYLLIMRLATVLEVALPIFATGLFVWLIVRLGSQGVRREFESPR